MGDGGRRRRHLSAKKSESSRKSIMPASELIRSADSGSVNKGIKK